MADLYNEDVMDHFMNPRNVGVLKNPDGVGETGNPTCGDIMKMYIKVGKNGKGEEYIEDIKFQTFGCGAAVATSSKTTEMMKGKSIAEAKALTNGDVAKELGGLPDVKMHCSNLAAHALHAAIKDYEAKKK
jgi:nitrogen fixation protein NifU and related proteins